MNFSEALDAMKQGKKLSRESWNGKGLSVQIQFPDEHSKMTHRYVYLEYPPTATYPSGSRVPWFATQTDLLLDDWFIVE